jgi:hypothetical protein
MPRRPPRLKRSSSRWGSGTTATFPAAQINPEPAPTPYTGPVGPAMPQSTSTPDQTDDQTGYDQSFKHLGGHWAAINAWHSQAYIARRW